MGKRDKFTTTLDHDLLIETKKKAIETNQDVNEIIEALLKKWLGGKK